MGTPAPAGRPTGYDQPTPDASLTNIDRREITVLNQMPVDEFDRRVSEWVSSPDESGARVFFSAALAERTFATTGRLIEQVDHQLGQKRGNRDATRDLMARKALLTKIRARARDIRRTLKAQSAREQAGPRRKAQKLLAELHHRDFQRLKRGLEGGRDGADLLAEMRAELAARDRQ